MTQSGIVRNGRDLRHFEVFWFTTFLKTALKRCAQYLGGMRPGFSSQEIAQQESLNRCQYESQGLKVKGKNIPVIGKCVGNSFQIAQTVECIVSAMVDNNRWKTYHSIELIQSQPNTTYYQGAGLPKSYESVVMAYAAVVAFGMNKTNPSRVLFLLCKVIASHS